MLALSLVQLSPSLLYIFFGTPLVVSIAHFNHINHFLWRLVKWGHPQVPCVISINITVLMPTDYCTRLVVGQYHKIGHNKLGNILSKDIRGSKNFWTKQSWPNKGVLRLRLGFENFICDLLFLASYQILWGLCANSYSKPELEFDTDAA